MMQSTVNSLCGVTPSFQAPKLDSPENMLKKLNKVALPAILLFGATAVQGADAIGCLGCAICLATGVIPPCIPICVICGVTIPVPLG